MRGMAWIALLLIGLPGIALAAEPVKPLDFNKSVWIQVDSAGHAKLAEEVQADKKADALASIVQDRLKSRIESWKFTPATRDGIPVASKTNLMLALEAYDDGNGGLGIRVMSASTGARIEPINYKKLLDVIVMGGEEGRMTIDVRYGADGKVIAASVHDSQRFVRGRFAYRIPAPTLQMVPNM